VNKHLAKVDGVPVFNALWTCMDSHYIHAQALTLTKAHEERYGPLNGVARSIKRFGHSMPQIAFSDDPVKVDPVYCMFKIGFTCYQDASMLTTAFPLLKESLTLMAAAYGLAALNLPESLNILWLSTPELTELAILSILAPIENDPAAHVCVSLDAEWNISCHTGVSIIQIAPHAISDSVFIIPVGLLLCFTILDLLNWPVIRFINLATVTTSTNSGFTAVTGDSQYLIMPKHLSKELAEPMNINWKTSSQVSTGLRMDKCQSSTIIINKLKTS